ncbi:translation initiation factor IF-2-like [Schistocerca americana]|uniref:translation initiation factor IF-2-like n=1 Tax=Schistocerca americana TaxID=7009 RepID=UPI001F503399|nr:translation initiation factor IF-2-like [Schistocerca americana]
MRELDNDEGSGEDETEFSGNESSDNAKDLEDDIEAAALRPRPALPSAASRQPPDAAIDAVWRGAAAATAHAPPLTQLRRRDAPSGRRPPPSPPPPPRGAAARAASAPRPRPRRRHVAARPWPPGRLAVINQKSSRAECAPAIRSKLRRKRGPAKGRRPRPRLHAPAAHGPPSVAAAAAAARTCGRWQSPGVAHAAPRVRPAAVTLRRRAAPQHPPASGAPPAPRLPLTATDSPAAQPARGVVSPESRRGEAGGGVGGPGGAAARLGAPRLALPRLGQSQPALGGTRPARARPRRVTQFAAGAVRYLPQTAAAPDQRTITTTTTTTTNMATNTSTRGAHGRRDGRPPAQSN